MAILEFNGRLPLDLASFASAEAQAAAIADDVAYNAHDIDDGLRAGLFAIEDLRAVDFVGDLVREIDARHPGLEPGRFVHELGRRLITRFVEDAIREGGERLAQAAPQSAADVRAQHRPLVTFSAPMQAADKAIKGFLYPHMYRHPRVMKVRVQAAEVVRRLTRAFLKEPALMPGEWALAAQAARGDEMRMARLICDYIAGMTDRFALAEHRRLFGEAPELR